MPKTEIMPFPKWTCRCGDTSPSWTHMDNLGGFQKDPVFMCKNCFGAPTCMNVYELIDQAAKEFPKGGVTVKEIMIYCGLAEERTFQYIQSRTVLIFERELRVYGWTDTKVGMGRYTWKPPEPPSPNSRP